MKPPIRKAQPVKAAKPEGVDPARFVTVTSNYDLKRPKRKVLTRTYKPK